MSGVVTDTGTNAPLPAVLITSGSSSLARTDSNGEFEISIPMGRDIPLTFTRSGYDTLTTSVNISGDSTQTFKLTTKPTVKVRLTNGTNLELDTDTIEFGYLAPFTGYSKDTRMNLCTTGGNLFSPDRTEIRRITPANALNDATCCSSTSLPAVSVELKSGTTTVGGFLDACFGYKSDLIALDHKTGEAAYIHFSDIAEITFP